MPITETELDEALQIKNAKSRISDLQTLFTEPSVPAEYELKDHLALINAMMSQEYGWNDGDGVKDIVLAKITDFYDGIKADLATRQTVLQTNLDAILSE